MSDNELDRWMPDENGELPMENAQAHITIRDADGNPVAELDVPFTEDALESLEVDVPSTIEPEEGVIPVPDEPNTMDHDAIEDQWAEDTGIDQDGVDAYLRLGEKLDKQIQETTERVKNMQDDHAMKWRVADTGLYTSVGHTTKTIPPGVYDITVDSRGTVYWQEIEPRTDDIIRFANAPIDEVVSEIEKFWARENQFRRYGLPFKRGILLHGPPGSGKSCTLQLVAREMVKRGGYVVQFNSVEHFVAGYRILRSVQPKAPLVVLMEDFDEILKGKSSSGESRILNLLDGIESTDNVVFLATTNYLSELGPRIINRPSRFDHRIMVAHPKESDRRTYLETLILADDDEPIDVDRFVKDTSDLSLAHVKELFVAAHILGENYEDCVKRLQGMKTKPTSIDDGDDPEAFMIKRGGYA